VFVAEAGGIQVFSPANGGGLTLSCEQYLPTALTSEGGAFAELSYLPNGVDVAGGIESPGAIFYNATALSTCTGTGVVISQGTIASDQGSQAVAVTPDGKYAFVSNEYGVASGATTEGNIGVVSLTYDSNGNVTGGTLLGQISTGGQAIAGMVLSPDGTRLYVTSEISKNSSAVGTGSILTSSSCVQQAGGAPQANGILSVINVATAEVSQNSSAILATVNAGCSPVRMAETADNSTLWIAVRGDNRVLAFSTGMLELNAANALVGYASTGGTAPVGIALFRNQSLLAVANSNRFGTGPTANLTLLSVGYPPAASVVQTVTTGLFPREVNVGSDDATLYLSNYDSNTLEVVTTK
jgi:6-phosphogluconolactonase (cycloisomerase 2 family)